MDNDDFEAELNKSLDRASDAFQDKYKEELAELLRMCAEDLKLRPQTTNTRIYRKLIATVETASTHNLPVGELKERIEALGSSAVRIAKRVTSLAGLFA
jgi:hypothetical protein